MGAAITLDLEGENAEFFLGAILAEVSAHIEALHSFLDNIALEEFSANPMRQDAVLLRIMSIERLLKKTTPAKTINDKTGLMEDFKEIRWSDYKGMSDMFAHDYFEPQLTYPREIIHEDLPRLEAAINKILSLYPNAKESFDIEWGNIKYKNSVKQRKFLDIFKDGSKKGEI